MIRLLLLMVMVLSISFAQNLFHIQSDTLRYAISTSQAKAFFDGEKIDISETEAFIDTVRQQDVHSKDSLKSGYYLDVYAKDNRVHQSVFGISDIDWHLADFKGKGVLRLNMGEYDGYQLLKKGKREVRFRKDKFGWPVKHRYIGKPYLLVKDNDSVWVFLQSRKRHIQQRLFWNPETQSTYNYPIFYRQDGYMVTHQPMYRLGDTVKIKAYVRNDQGEPFTGRMYLSISENQQSYYNRKEIVKDTLKPSHPGAFVYEFVAGDSLKIDQDYSIILKTRYRSVSTNFRLEDYVLEDASYTAKLTADSLELQIPPLLRLEAKAANGLPVMDGKAQISIKLKDVKEHDLQKVVSTFPETLYADTVDLDPSGTTHIHLPDSSLRYLGASYRVKVNFSDGSGDLVDTSFTVELLHPEPKLHYRWQTGSLAIDSISFPIGWVGDRRQQVDVVKTGIVSLPYITPFDPNISAYSVKYLDEAKTMQVPANQVFGTIQRKGDSTSFSLQNPLGLPVFWELWQEGQVVYSGEIREHLHKHIDSKPTIAKWSYFWAGSEQRGMTRHEVFGDALSLEIEQPAEASPGDSVDVVLRLKDGLGRPIANADLTAWAIHSRFTEVDLPKLQGTTASIKHDFLLPDLKSYRFRGDNDFPLFRNWADPLGVSETSAWNFQYPDSVNLVYQPLEHEDSTLAALAIFSKYHGNSEEVLMVRMGYKLMYSATMENPSYAIIAKPGMYSKVVVRTNSHRYILENIELKKGQKLDLSFNYERWRERGDSDEMGPLMSKEEAQLLNSKSMKVEFLGRYYQDHAYVSDGLRVWSLARIYRERTHVIGPFGKGQRLTFGQKDKFKFTERFDPDHLYSFREGFIKLTPSTLYEEGSWWNTSKSPQDPGDMPRLEEYYLASQNPSSEYVWKPRFVPSNSTYYTEYSGNATVRLIGKRARKMDRVSLILDDRVWNFMPGEFKLPEGKHRLFIHHEDSTFSILEYTFKGGLDYWIHADSLTYIPDSITPKLQDNRLLEQRTMYRGSASLSLRMPASAPADAELYIGRKGKLLFHAPVVRLGERYVLNSMPYGDYTIAMISPKDTMEWNMQFELLGGEERTVDLEKALMQPFITPPDTCIPHATTFRIHTKKVQGDLSDAFPAGFTGSIKGFVYSAEKEKLVAARVMAFDGSTLVKETHTDTAGAYRLDGLPTGKVRIHIIHHYSEEIIDNQIVFPNQTQDLNILFLPKQKNPKRPELYFDKNWFEWGSWFGRAFFKKKMKEDSVVYAEVKKVPDGSGKIAGTIIDGAGEKAAFATILVFEEGDTFVAGAQSNEDGKYNIYPIAPGTYDVVFKYFYQEEKLYDVTVNPNSTRYIDQKFKNQSLIMDEVVIVSSSYDIPVFEKDAPAGTTVSSTEIRSIGTRDVNTLTSITPGVSSTDEGDNSIRIKGARSNATVYYVDGQKVRGGVNLPQSSIATLQVTTGGTPADGGAYYQDGTGNRVLRSTSYRRNGLSRGNPWDSLSWQNGPGLTGLDQFMPATFRLRSDWRDYAYWQPLLRTDAQGEARFRAILPGQLTAWNSYAIATATDGRMALVRGSIRSIQSLAGKLDVPRFLLAGDEVEVRGRALNYTEETLLASTSFRVGEEMRYRWSDSLKHVHSDTLRLTAETDTMALSYQVNLESGSGDGERREIPVLPVGMFRSYGEMAYLEGDTSHTFQLNVADSTVKLLIADSPLEMMLEQLDYLKNYVHACNEQTASKLKALLLKQEIMDSLDRPFNEKRLIKRLAKRLIKNQNIDGGWGWWPNGDSRTWISLHVVEALRRYDSTHASLPKAQDFLIDKYDYLRTSEKLGLLQHFVEAKADVAVESLLAEIPDSLYADPWTAMLHAKLLKSMNKPWISDSLFDKIDSLKSDTYRWAWYGSSVDKRLLTYQLERDHDTLKRSLPRRRLFLEELGTYRRNTFETAKILSVLIPEFLQNKPEKRKQVTEVQWNGLEEPVQEFPLRKTLQVPEDGKLVMDKRGLGPLTITVAQEYWEPSPERTDSIYAISTRWIQEGKEVDSVTIGQALTYEVTVEVKEIGTEVALTIPIPANCFWKDKPKASWREAHREYHKDRLNVYFDRLSVGKHTFRLKLEPRFAGRFTVNPVQCFPMYELLRSGNTVVRKVVVE